MADQAPDSIQRNLTLPKHIGFIMDGNGRWASGHGLQREDGHKYGVDSIENLIQHMSDVGIQYVTLYAFSTENWNRPKSEVTSIFSLLRSTLSNKLERLIEANIQVRHIGNLKGINNTTRIAIERAIDATISNTGMTVIVAINYGGRKEIVDAVKTIIAADIKPEEITETTIEEHLYTSSIPHPDLIIRTGGEFRTSNFLLWQSAYSEYYITDTLWPDFTVEHLKQAILSYQTRQRRFGRVKSDEG
ncbi:MAG: di-trans,poly-cis-decaprenylcistransferase [SAR202 cluster bacterium]|nr:di-trans,poly-cis-decaprenylcistransferase [SAR202 cluster bacterium]MQG52471.1 di-trans,poly-cis-decaprenylcistransferase [SAR202 cluster bacterium]|tara:strand:- start:4778 stop:5515 length:738 start_codon:yes stop_codon:yes gene_type:complete